MVQVQTCRRAPPKVVCYHRVQEGLWHSSDGRQQLRCTGRFTCVLRRQSIVGGTESLYGLWSGSQILLREPAGPIVEVKVTLLPGGERMHWSRPLVVLPPPPDPLNCLSVEYSPNTHEFHSRDGRLVGQVNLRNGRLWSQGTGPEWSGLAGNGLVVLVSEDHPVNIYRVTSLAHATFLLEGGNGLFRAAVAS